MTVSKATNMRIEFAPVVTSSISVISDIPPSTVLSLGSSNCIELPAPTISSSLLGNDIPIKTVSASCGNFELVSKEQSIVPANNRKRSLSSTTNKQILAKQIPQINSENVKKVRQQMQPILKNENLKQFCDQSRRRPSKDCSSKYVGVYYETAVNKWRAQMMIHGKVTSLGHYDNEEAAGIAYAKAAHKYKVKASSVTSQIYGGLDLSHIPNQSLILRPDCETKFAPCLYKGVRPNKKRWQTRIMGPKGKEIHLGTFDTPEEAAQVYSNAVYFLETKNNNITDQYDGKVPV